MAFEVVINNANRVVATRIQAETLVSQVQNIFGQETQIKIVEVLLSYDGKTADAKELGTARRVIAIYPDVPIGV